MKKVAATPKPPPDPVTPASDGKLFGEFFVPSFEVRIRGRKLPNDVVRDVVQVTYKDGVNEIDSFQLTVNNWDADLCDFKYVGIEKKFAGDDPRMRYAHLFDPGDTLKEVEIWMGYGGERRLMMTGFITTLEPNFPQSGASTLEVRGLNVLWQFKGKPQTDFWPKDGKSVVKDSDIAVEIGQRMDRNTDRKKLPLKIRIDPTARNDEPEEDHVFQNNQPDIVFLLARASRHGYVIVLEAREVNGRRQEQLYFGPSEAGMPNQREVTYLLEWGKSLIQFKPTLTTANQVNSVTVRGWDRRRKRAVTGTATRKSARMNQDLSDLDPAFAQREEIIADRPVPDRRRAQRMAEDILNDHLKDLVKGSGSTIGLPDLRAGRKVFIAGLGGRFSGTYFITGTTHAINDSGYITSFTARREESGDAKIL